MNQPVNNGAPQKQCPRCEKFIHAARTHCFCGYEFRSKEDPLPVKNLVDTIIGTVNQCLPPGYTYAGHLNIANKAIYVAYVGDDERLTFKHDTLNGIVEVCWRHSMNRIPKNQLAKHIL